ncbi:MULTISPECIES: rcc01693 family protein [unclassified Ruegeria]|uniref:rcc01693 family protein n=1 Tax=unclassified Ruegeria TaxID=2625375 RepID=UPI001ADACCFF|nr:MULTISPECIES: rcc01693 family protein [unclassified Ruegeria]MBO9410396.1 phage tail assembly chaperone [Ruegeria sp. R8_1]MBO9414385.1 phage tail assembly chaperone [Ruegeria sp. R8_2]
MSGFDWPALMRAGMTGLRLTPEQFWRLTPAELRLMLGQGAGTPAMNRAGLDALLAAYPDKEQGERDDDGS